MKHAISVPAIVCIAFIAGCEQDNNPVTEVAPFLGDIRALKPKNGDTILPLNVIVLSRLLREPRRDNAIVEIRGNVYYSMTIVSLNPTEPDPRYAASITLAARGALGSNDDETSAWTISADSHDEMPLGEGGSVTFEKRYVVAGRTDGLMLIIRFRASVGALAEQHLEMVGMWLDLSNVEHAGN